MRRRSMIAVVIISLLICSGCFNQAAMGPEDDDSAPSVKRTVYFKDPSILDEVYTAPTAEPRLVPSPLNKSAMKEQQAPLKSEQLLEEPDAE